MVLLGPPHPHPPLWACAFHKPQIHFTQYLCWYSFSVNMRELWGWEIGGGREFSAHCRHSRETEIRILNRTKNRVFSSKPRLWLGVETNPPNMSGKMQEDAFRSASLAGRESYHSIVWEMPPVISHSPDLLQDEHIFTMEILALPKCPLNSEEIFGQKSRYCEEREHHGQMELQLHAPFSISNLRQCLSCSISPGMNLNLSHFLTR